MATIQINPDRKDGFKDAIHSLSKLKTADIERFMLEMRHMLAKRKTSNLSKRESELLLAINDSWSTEKWKQYQLLGQKLQEETMTEDEHQVYMKLVDEKQDRAIVRLSNLIELAALRKVSVSALTEELGIDKPSA